MKSDLTAGVIDELSAGGRVLVTRMQFLGDVILTLPVVAALRARFPKAEIDYLSRAEGADVLIGESTFHNVWKLPEKRDGALATWRLVSNLRRRKYSVTIDFYSNPRSALLSRLTGARIRIGGDRRVRRRFFTHPTKVPPSVRSAMDHHFAYASCLDISSRLEKPTLSLSQSERQQATAQLQKYGVVGDKRVVGIHPGGKWEVKRWPVQSFAALCKRLTEVHNAQVVVLCGPGEGLVRDELRSLVGDTVVFIPTLPIRQTAALISTLDSMVVCDGGIMHVSVAVGTPTVGIFGSAEPDIWFPYEQFGPYIPAFVPIVCRPCHSHFCSHISCLRHLTVEMVEQKTLDAMGARSPHQS